MAKIAEESMGPGDLAPESKTKEVSEAPAFKFDVDSILAIVKLPLTQAIAIITGAVVFGFWRYFQNVFATWTDPDSIYQHGPLIPFAIAYIIWANWDKLSEIPVKPSWLGLPVLLGALYANFLMLQSGALGSLMTFFCLVTVASIIVFLLGFRWMLVSIPLMAFASLGLPGWATIVDERTYGAQILSTEGAFHLLNLAGFDPFRRAPTVIDLNNFTLNIAAACSGMKLTLAMAASVFFIMMIARLKWWANLTLAALAIPLSIAINALRIALIGVVGDTRGHDAGMWMHDYGSYGTLVLAFYLMYLAAKGLGWKV